MIRHIVMWKYREGLTTEEKTALLNNLNKAAEDMRGKVEGLLDIHLEKNVNEKEKYDICLYCEFETLENVDNYQVHPLHLVFKDIITGNVVDRACIDCTSFN